MLDHIIIGGGLSGLYQARILLKENPSTKILILEANGRLGGRIYSPYGHDMGGTWVWPSNDHRVISLCLELGITQFENNDGENCSDSIDISDDRNHLPSQLRFIGGSEQMIHGILNDFPNEGKHEKNIIIHCQHKVIAIDKSSGNSSSVVIAMDLKTQQKVSFVADKTITIAIPPRIILRDITFTKNNDVSFQLPCHKKAIMEQTPIWMEGASKVFLTYKQPIWKDQNQHQLSLPLTLQDGVFVFDVTNDNKKRNQCWINNNKNQNFVNLDNRKEEEEEDTTNDNDNINDRTYYTICLFRFWSPTPITNESLSQTYLKILSHLFGSRMISQLHHTQIHNWASEPFTSSKINTSADTSTTSNIPPSYLFGNSELRKPLDDNIFFSSTETEQEHGHMEGALKAGERAAAQVTKYVESL